MYIIDWETLCSNVYIIAIPQVLPSMLLKQCCLLSRFSQSRILVKMVFFLLMYFQFLLTIRICLLGLFLFSTLCLPAFFCNCLWVYSTCEYDYSFDVAISFHIFFSGRMLFLDNILSQQELCTYLLPNLEQATFSYLWTTSLTIGLTLGAHELLSALIVATRWPRCSFRLMRKVSKPLFLMF